MALFWPWSDIGCVESSICWFRNPDAARQGTRHRKAGHTQGGLCGMFPTPEAAIPTWAAYKTRAAPMSIVDNALPPVPGWEPWKCPRPDVGLAYCVDWHQDIGPFNRKFPRIDRSYTGGMCASDIQSAGCSRCCPPLSRLLRRLITPPKRDCRDAVADPNSRT